MAGQVIVDMQYWTCTVGLTACMWATIIIETVYANVHCT